MSKIKSLLAREILDSRGNPTVEVLCTLESDVSAKASVPSGASTGVFEAVELRDKDNGRYNGLGVLSAVLHVNTEIVDALRGKEFDQKTLDNFLVTLDGTSNKSRLGANAILGVSLAFAYAKAKEDGVELYEYFGSLAQNNDFCLPHLMFNIINGGKHADSGLDIQEFMISPIGIKTIKEKVRAGREIITSLQKELKEKGYAVSVGDEGGFAPKLSAHEEAFVLIQSAILDAGYTTEQVKIAIDVASSCLYENGVYRLRIDGQEKELTSDELILWYEKIINLYPIISIEDGLAENDFEGFSKLNGRLGKKVLIVGDDLTVTNVSRIEEAALHNSVNSVLIKPNQIGTLTETIEAILLTKKQGWSPFVSHRSGETTDTMIADLSVGLACPYIKSGSLARGERVCKYNRLMEVEEKIQNRG